MISVVIPLYNKANQVVATLQSVLAQTFTDHEIIVVDDGSTDGSSEIVESLNIPNLRLIRQQNAGVSAARNCGIAAAQGEFIALLDADDEWKPDYLQTQFNLTQKYPECDVFATAYEHRDAKGKITNIILNKLPFDGEDGILGNYFEVAVCSSPPVWTSAVMLKSLVIQSINGFPEGIANGEDLLTWARLALKFKIAYCRLSKAIYSADETLYNEDQKSRKPAEVDRVGIELQKLYKSNTSVKGLKQYIGHWHKMRGRHYIIKHYRINALKEIFTALKYNLTLKTFVLLCLCLTPMEMANKIIRKYTH